MSDAVVLRNKVDPEIIQKDVAINDKSSGDVEHASPSSTTIAYTLHMQLYDAIY